MGRNELSSYHLLDKERNTMILSMQQTSGVKDVSKLLFQSIPIGSQCVQTMFLLIIQFSSFQIPHNSTNYLSTHYYYISLSRSSRSQFRNTPQERYQILHIITSSQPDFRGESRLNKRQLIYEEIKYILILVTNDSECFQQFQFLLYLIYLLRPHLITKYIQIRLKLSLKGSQQCSGSQLHLGKIHHYITNEIRLNFLFVLFTPS